MGEGREGVGGESGLEPQASTATDERSWLTWFSAQERGLPPEDLSARGSKIYEQSCAQCHGDRGEGAIGAYPALAGNRAVTMDVPATLIRVVLNGGYLPATAGNPRPYGMPPFTHIMNDAEIAAVISFIRGAWGNAAGPVSELEVMHYRAGRID